MKRVYTIIGLATIFVCASISYAHAQAGIELSSGSRRVALGDTFDLRVRLKNVELSDLKIDGIKNFEVVDQRRSSSFSFSFGTGRGSSRTSSEDVVFVLRPKKTGALQVGPARGRYNGKTVSSNRVTIEVTPAAQQAPPISAENAKDGAYVLDPDAFIRTHVSKAEVFQGEGIIVTFDLYTARSVQASKYVQPAMNGFIVKELTTPKSRRAEVINGQRYTISTLGRVAAFPQKKGTLTIQPPEIDLVSQDFFSQKRMRRSGVAVSVKVRDLPKDAYLVGPLRVNAALNPTTLTVGDATTLTLALSGPGAYWDFEPQLELPSGFRLLKPHTSESLADAPKLVMTRRYEWVLVAESPGQTTISLRIPKHVEAEAKTIQDEIIKTFEVNVVGAGQAASATTSKPEARENSERDEQVVLPALRTTSELTREQRSMLRSPFYWLALALAPLLSFFYGWWRRRRRKRAGRRDRLRDGVAQLWQRKNDPSILNDIENFILEMAGQRAQENVRGHTRGHVASILTDSGVDASAVDEMLEVLDEVDQARFADADVDLDALIGRAEAVAKMVTASAEAGRNAGRLSGIATQLFLLAVGGIVMLSGVMYAPRATAESAHEQTLKSLFAKANQHAFRGDYKTAVLQYRKLLSAGVSDPDVHYNLAYGYAMREQYGRAIYHLEKTLMLRSADGPARTALATIRAQIAKTRVTKKGSAEYESQPSLGQALLAPFSENVLGVLLILLALVVCVLPFWGGQSESVRLLRWVALPFLAVLLSVTLWASLYKVEVISTRHEAIVFENAQLVAGPLPDAQRVSDLVEGSRVEVIARENEFYRVRTSDQKEGWVKNKAIGRL